MKYFFLLAITLTPIVLSPPSGNAQESNSLDSLLPVRGFCVGVPSSERLDEFLHFVENELASKSVNTLILRIDYKYQYESHPELRSNGALSKDEIKKIVATAKKNGIRLIPQVNLLGHQSWHTNLNKLLTEYPAFDETPHIKLPKEYKWPNEDGLYCKSYCPLHPDVHQVVFALIDEIMEAFEADAFHAGMDEVFFIGDDNCPRCKGKDKGVLFAGEVNKIRNHLAKSDRELWIWGDRLIDGEASGLGMWEASTNGTHTAIDLIEKDVVICDWHYRHAEPTAAYFAIKGLRVITCPWKKPDVAIAQLKQTLVFRKDSNPAIGQRVVGIMQTVWSGPEQFIDVFNGKIETKNERELGPVETYRKLFEEISKLVD